MRPNLQQDKHLQILINDFYIRETIYILKNLKNIEGCHSHELLWGLQPE